MHTQPETRLSHGSAKDEHTHNDQQHQHPAPAASEITKRHDNDRQHGERLISAFKDSDQLGHHEGHHQHDHDAGKHHDEGRVNHRLGYRPSRVVAGFQVVGKLLQHLLQVPALLPRGHCRPVHFGESTGKGFETARQAKAFANLGPHSQHDAFNAIVGGLFGDRRQGLLHRQAGFQQGCQLPCHQRLLCSTEFARGRKTAKPGFGSRVLGFVDFNRNPTLVTQLLTHLAGTVGLKGSFSDFAPVIQGSKFKCRHLPPR